MKKNNPMKAVVLAAGLGSRISKITSKIPKSMIRIENNYIFKIIIDALIKININEIIFVVGYKSRLLRDAIDKEYSQKNIKIFFVTNKKYASTNTMYSLWLARKKLDCSFLYLHGDLIFSEKMINEFLMNRKSNAILVDKRFPLDWDDAMKVIAHNNELKYMSKQITLNEMDGIAIGIYKFDKNGAKILFEIISGLISKGIVKSWVSEAMNILAKRIPITIEYNNKNYPWTDVDNLSDLKMGNKIFKEIID